MSSTQSDVSKLEAHLGGLAMRFRGTRAEAERRRIATEYAKVVDERIDGGAWREPPAPEDQLPDAWMPLNFLEFWHSQAGQRQPKKKRNKRGDAA